MSPQIWSWFVQIITALRFMASQRVLHRDIKPQNIMMGGPDGMTLKLADFGVSKALSPSVRVLMCSPIAPLLITVATGRLRQIHRWHAVLPVSRVVPWQCLRPPRRHLGCRGCAVRAVHPSTPLQQRCSAVVAAVHHEQPSALVLARTCVCCRSTPWRVRVGNVECSVSV